MTDTPTYVRMEPNGPLPNVEHYRPFKAVVVLDGTYSNEWQDVVSRWLVDSGCLYMMAWGPDCTTWDDSVDYAMIQKFPEEPPDDQFVMTTWHDGETLEDVFWYSQFNAAFSFGDVELNHALIIHIGSSNREQELLALYEQSRDLAEREAQDFEPVKSESWFKKLFRF